MLTFILKGRDEGKNYYASVKQLRRKTLYVLNIFGNTLNNFSLPFSVNVCHQLFFRYFEEKVCIAFRKLTYETISFISHRHIATNNVIISANAVLLTRLSTVKLPECRVAGLIYAFDGLARTPLLWTVKHDINSKAN
jgi:hypothetical protein